eukprot:2364182-Pyramimonas_sp.AAC.1
MASARGLLAIIIAYSGFRVLRIFPMQYLGIALSIQYCTQRADWFNGQAQDLPSFPPAGRFPTT